MNIGKLSLLRHMIFWEGRSTVSWRWNKTISRVQCLDWYWMSRDCLSFFCACDPPKKSFQEARHIYVRKKDKSNEIRTEKKKTQTRNDRTSRTRSSKKKNNNGQRVRNNIKKKDATNLTKKTHDPMPTGSTVLPGDRSIISLFPQPSFGKWIIFYDSNVFKRSNTMT